MVLRKILCFGALFGCLGVACGSTDDDSGLGDGNSGSGAKSGSGSGAVGAGGSGGTVNIGGTGSSSSGGSIHGGGGDDSCEADFAGAELQPVYLAFAFDVSGSMGKGDETYHDKSLKWDPVVAATKAFFADESSSGIRASLTFFPSEVEDERCDESTYETPDVPMTLLPSTDFSDAIDDVTPMSMDEWRGGTPTLPVTQGTLGFIASIVTDDPTAKYVYVLVTDGYPNGCDDNTIENVVDEVSAVADEIPTYVIGVSNPEPGPDTVSDLNDIAVAGGTETAFLIGTGDAQQTSDDFKAAVDAIRAKAVTCEATIPENPGGTPFDKSFVNVNYTKDGQTMDLGYDENCVGDQAWHYDDADAPTKIVLCPDTCDAVKADPSLQLNVGFGCVTVPAVK